MRRIPLALTLLLGCSNPGEPTGNATEPKPDPAAPEPKPEPKPEPTLPSHTLIVGDEQGLHEYELGGKRLATLVTGPATLPRVLPDGRIAFLRDDGDQLTLWLYASGSPAKQVAELPRYWSPKRCKATSSPTNQDDDGLLAVQAPDHFRIDPSKHQACVLLQDRNDSMVNYGVMLLVSLKDGGLRQSVYVDLEGTCEADGAFACDDIPSPSPPPPATASFAFAFDEATATFSGPGRASQRLCGGGGEDEGEDECASIDSSSESGRFVLLTGATRQGDYSYRDLIVLDRQDGTLWTITAKPDAMLAITAAQMFALDDAFTAVAESDIRWLPNDHLWLDGQLVDPAARKVTSIGGSLGVRLVDLEHASQLLGQAGAQALRDGEPMPAR